MRISGNEPSSVILAKQCRFKSWKMIAQKGHNKLKLNGMVKLPHKITISIYSNQLLYL